MKNEMQSKRPTKFSTKNWSSKHSDAGIALQSIQNNVLALDVVRYRVILTHVGCQANFFYVESYVFIEVHYGGM